MMQSENHFDVLVVGGGMVGAATALALGRASDSLKVGLVEARRPEYEWESRFDMRVSALTRTSQQLLQGLGAWDDIVSQGATSYRNMKVWDENSSGVLDFDSHEINEPDLGHIVENRIIVAALWKQLDVQDNVEQISPDQPDGWKRDNDRVVMSLASGRTVTASVMVAADGARSALREQAGIQTRGWSYDQVGVVTIVKPSKGHQGVAWQRFLKTGPLAFLPMPNDHASIVWSTTPAQAEQLINMPESEFLTALEVASEGQLGSFEAAAPRAGFPLRLQHSLNYVQPGLVLVGDAAHAIHPLAGQGVNLGFKDVIELVEVLSSAHEARKNLGSMPVLRRFERARKGDNLRVMGAMDVIKRLFAVQAAPVSMLRGVGMNLVSGIPALRAKAMREALGLNPSGIA